MKTSHIYCVLCPLAVFLAVAGCSNPPQKLPSDSVSQAATQKSEASESEESVQAVGPVSGSGRGYAAVRLGIRPGMGSTEEPGVLVQSVSTGTSAEKGGMLAGDLIVGWGGEDLVDVMDMVERLRSQSPGDEVPFVVIRDGEEVELMIIFQASDDTQPN